MNTITTFISNSFGWSKEMTKTFIKLFLLLLLMFLLGYTVLTMYYNPMNDNNDWNKSEQSRSSGSSRNYSNNIKVQSDKDMHQLGKHFNKHGRGMGYSSKKEYQRAAVEFAEKYKSNPNANIFRGKWNGSGKFNLKEQFAIKYENKTVIIDKVTGQIVNFYKGGEMRGLIEILKIH